MNRIYKLICLLVILVCVLSLPVFAADYDGFSINDEMETVTITGTPTDALPGDAVNIQMLKQGLTKDDINDTYVDKTELLNDFTLFTQVALDENGAYSETVSMVGEKPGYYIIRVNGNDVAEIYYATKKNREKIVELIQENCIGDAIEEEDAVNYLSENFALTDKRSVWVNCFNINDPLVFEVSEDDLFKVFISFIPDLTINNIKENIHKSAYIAAINEGKADVINYKEVFDFDEKYVEVYDKYLSSEERTAFTGEYFKGKGYNTAAKISQAFEDSVIIKWINTLSGWGEVEELIETFGEDIGINMTSSDDKYNFDDLKTSQQTELYENILDKKSFASVEKFAEYVNDEMEDIIKDSKSGSGGGSGGSGGGFAAGSGSANTQLVTPAVTPIDPDAEPEVTSGFNDMEGYDWAKESVETLAEKGIVSGTGTGSFEPGRNVTREEFVVMLMRAYGVTKGSADTAFTDSVDGSWYADYLSIAKSNGYVNGKPDGTFGVGDAITREDACVMAYNIAKSQGKILAADTADMFADNDEIATYAYDAVYALKNASVINGKGEGMFAPKANCTRAEAAKIIYTLISL